MSTLVRLKIDLPHHGKDRVRSDINTLEPSIRGAVVLIGKPVTPTNFTCDTDIVWPIEGPPEFIEMMNWKQIHYVCRHQIEAGD